MPRGVKGSTTEKKIAEIDLKITKKRDEIKALEAQRRELMDAQQTELAAKVVRIAAEKGVTVEELLKAVEK